jgi:hypothetical protein
LHYDNESATNAYADYQYNIYSNNQSAQGNDSSNLTISNLVNIPEAIAADMNHVWHDLYSLIITCLILIKIKDLNLIISYDFLEHKI